MTEQRQVDAKSALQAISPFLSEWRKASESDIVVSSISGGYMNTLYIVENKKGGDPAKVILRYYGGNFFDLDSKMAKENFIKNSETDEVMIFFEQSERGQGPKLYGVFPGGRIEEYVDNHTLTPEEAATPAIMKDLAINFARFHSLELPFPRDKIQRLSLAMKPRPDQSEEETAVKKAMLFQHPAIVRLGIDFSKIDLFDFKGEFTWLFTCLFVVPKRDTFITFDTNFLNVLVRNKLAAGQLKTVLVDYEMAIYGFRGLDLGGHFVNTMIKWNGEETKASGHEFPDEDQRREFLTYYLEESIKLNHYTPDERDTLDHVLMESDLGALFFSLFFCAITLKFAEKFAREPSFFTIIPLLQNFYINHKKECKEKYQHWP